MPLTFAGNLDRTALTRACAAVAELVADDRVGARWDDGSALPGLTVGGLVRHLVSQPECAVEFLSATSPADAATLSLAQLYERTDWFLAPVDHPANSSIVDDFTAMAAAGHPDSVSVLRRSLDALPDLVAAAGPTVHVPWQDCSLLLDDFLAVRLMEVVVHADDLAVSLGAPTPTFDDDVLHPVLALLALLGQRRHGQDAALRSLARRERADGPAAAF